MEQIRPGGPTEDEDELLWQVAQDWYRLLFTEGEFSREQLITVGLAWLNIGLWPTAKPQLDKLPEIRGPIAYFVGLQCLAQKNTKLAMDCFQTAISDAGNNARLKRLAEQQLQELNPD